MSKRLNYYSAEIKLQTVQDYIGGNGSLRVIWKKHGTAIFHWVCLHKIHIVAATGTDEAFSALLFT